jgi:hypothetical protein
MGQLEIA